LVFSPNQNHGLARQFRDGVRGFNFDLFNDGSKIKTCHPPPHWCHNPENDIRGLMNELKKGRHDDSFIIIQLESHISTRHYDLLEKWFGNKLVKNFNKERTLGYYMERDQQVLIFTDKNPRPSQGIHSTSDFIVENKYEWSDRYGYPNMKYRRGPPFGRRMRLMNYFNSHTGLGDMVASKYVHDHDRALRNIKKYQEQRYTEGKINVLLVDYYEQGDVFKIQETMRMRGKLS